MKREKELLASFIVNFRKGKKIADPIEYAETCSALVQLYGSTEKVAEKLGIGRETVRILSKIVELPPEVKDILSAREIPLTVAFDIVPLDRSIQVEVAKAVVGLGHRDARKVIRRKSEDPHRSAENIRSEVLNELNKREIHIAMIALPKTAFELLKEESEDVPAFVNKLIDEWIARGYPLESSSSPGKENLVSLVLRLTRETSSAIARKTRNPANLIEKIVTTWLKREGKIRN